MTPASRRARDGRPDTPRRSPARQSRRRAGRRRGDRGAAKPATIESISADAPSESEAKRASASRTDPLARLAAAATFVRPASLHGGPRAIAASTISSSASGSSRKRRQRDRMVARTWPGRWEMIRISDRWGGSSTIFSSALALFRFKSSAQSTMAIRQPPKAADNWKSCKPVRTASTEISLASFFVAGCHSRRMRAKSGWAS